MLHQGDHTLIILKQHRWLFLRNLGSVSRARIHRISCAQKLAAMYSASEELNATDFCALLLYTTGPLSMSRITPEIKRRSSEFDVQSASLYTSKVAFSLHSANLIPKLRVVERYLSTRIAAFQLRLPRVLDVATEMPT